MGYLVYILRCGDGTLYTGCTNDLPRRLQAHQSGRAPSTPQPPAGGAGLQEAVPGPVCGPAAGGRHQTAGSQAEAGPDRGLPTGTAEK